MYIRIYLIYIYIYTLYKEARLDLFCEGDGLPEAPCTLNKIFETKAREIAESSGGYDHNDRH